jgi:cell division protease FtsH
VGLIGFLVLLAWVTQTTWNTGGQYVSWTEIKAEITADRVEEVVFEGDVVRAKKKVNAGDEQGEWIRAVRVESDEGFVALLEANDTPYRAEQNRSCMPAFAMLLLLPLLMFTGLWILLARREGPSGVAAFSRSAAKLMPEDGTGVTFADVAGVDEAAEELQEIVAFLKTPEKFTTLGGRPPKGVLLVGPPGTGKTLLARAVAGEAGVAFLSISGSDFVEMFVGVGAARVRDLFKTAVEHAPCIIFIDELDAVGKTRSGGGPGGNEEREQTLNQMLVEMDGFDNRKGVIVMAATNRPETLDSALMRPGRFDRQVGVDRPDLLGREAVLVVHSKRIKLSEAVDLKAIAQLTPGMAGADLANVLNEAALLAARREATSVETRDISEAIERVWAGLERKSRRLGDEERRTTAYHEVGHALCAAASPGADPVQKISIIPRGFSVLGYTWYRPEEERFTHTKAQLLNRITAAYGGLAAEELVMGDVTNGAANDIKQATEIARRMVTEFGMSKRLGAVRYSKDGANPFGLPTGLSGQQGSPETAEVIESEIRTILERCHERARQILRDNHVLLEEMSAHLLDHEVLDGDVMVEFLARAKLAESLEDQPTGEWVRQLHSS